MTTAIETVYKGYRFRSRPEARWAVFFDALDLKWQYEPERYRAGKARTYLPDFRIEDAVGPTWVEVKGEVERLDSSLLAEFVERQREPLLILGDVPHPEPLRMPTHPLLFVALDIRPPTMLEFEASQAAFRALREAGDEIEAEVLKLINRKSRPVVSSTDALFVFGSRPYISAANLPCLPDGDRLDGTPLPVNGHPRIQAAYHAARGARFEHGESGAAA